MPIKLQCIYQTLFIYPKNYHFVLVPYNGSIKLKQFRFLSSIITIGESSFCSCKSLFQVTISLSITSIEYSEFNEECSSLNQ